MEKNIKYPIEAFALAMVLFSSGMKEESLRRMVPEWHNSEVCCHL